MTDPLDGWIFAMATFALMGRGLYHYFYRATRSRTPRTGPRENWTPLRGTLPQKIR